MTVHLPRRPFALDPLIAEAKRRMRRRRLLGVLAAVAVAALAVGLTVALRSPGGQRGALGTSNDARGVQASIEHAVRANPASAGDRKQTFVGVRVSRVDRRYAVARTNDISAQGERQDDTGWLLLRTTTGWQVIFVGSDAPPCKVAPAGVRTELLGSNACFSP